LNDYGDILSKSNGAAFDYEMYIEDGPTPDRVWFWSDDTTPIQLASDDQVEITRWHHVAVTRSGSTVGFYIDGVASGGGTMTGAFGNNAYPVQIGDSGFAGGEFDGLMDEVRLSNIGRSADWIRAQYLSMNNSFVTYGQQETKGWWDSDWSCRKRLIPFLKSGRVAC